MDIFGIFLLNTGNSSVTCLNCYGHNHSGIRQVSRLIWLIARGNKGSDTPHTQCTASLSTRLQHVCGDFIELNLSILYPQCDGTFFFDLMAKNKFSLTHT